jgi:uncharacterized membrane protein HdeD (DUF308 family)
MTNKSKTSGFNSTHRWWTYLLMGLVLLAIGIWVFIASESGLEGLARYLSYGIIGTGLLGMLLAWFNRDDADQSTWNWGGNLAQALIGLVLLILPGLTLEVFSWLLALWLLVRGALIVVHSRTLKQRGVESSNWFLFGGILTILLAFFTVFNPFAGAVTPLFWVALNLLLTGALYVGLSFSFKNLLP